MRFITEFECDDTTWDATPAIVSYRKERGHLDMGEMIANYFNWKSRGETTPHGPVKERYSLEIEAFPMDKWLEFKQRLSKECNTPCPHGGHILNMLKELESFMGK